ncbi:MAG: hypothetical protein P0Y59_02755 [Candidatus Sphingomonas phytovorans]|nr:hypothetical protein [Sphingomonas sp.]WEK00631.1 MAG: hypothetical protein P0Y59_02755 [Sphingomonas sp.]
MTRACTPEGARAEEARRYAARVITGGAANRFRFKVEGDYTPEELANRSPRDTTTIGDRIAILAVILSIPAPWALLAWWLS